MYALSIEKIVIGRGLPNFFVLYLVGSLFFRMELLVHSKEVVRDEKGQRIFISVREKMCTTRIVCLIICKMSVHVKHQDARVLAVVVYIFPPVQALNPHQSQQSNHRQQETRERSSNQ